MIDTVANYQPDPLIKQAEAKIAAQLGLKPEEVTISRDPLVKEAEHRHFARAVGESDTKPTKREAVDLYVTIHKPGLDVREVESTQQVRTGLSRFQSISNVVQMTPIEVETKNALDALKRATEGTSFNKKLLENFNFDPEIAKEGRTHNHLMDYPRISSYGADFRLRVEAHKGEDVTKKTNDIAEYFKKDGGAAFKAKLGGRVAKYEAENFVLAKIEERKLAKTQENVTKIGEEFKKEIDALKAKAVEGVSKLVVHTNTNAEHGTLEVSVSSVEQNAAKEKNKEWRYHEAENADALKATNPLHLLSTKEIPATETEPRKEPQIYRALGRALQDIPHYTEVAGIVDMRNLIGKEMARIYNTELKDKPQQQQLLLKVAKSPIFLEHHSHWSHHAQQVGDAPSEPKFRRIEHKNDLLEVQLTLTRIPGQKDPVASMLENIVHEKVADHTAQPPVAPSQPAAPTQAPIAQAIQSGVPVSEAIAAAGAACPPGQQAVAEASVKGAEAAAGAACVPQPQISEHKDGITLPNGQKISSKTITSFLKEVGGSHGDRAEAAKNAPVGRGMGA